MKKLLLLILFMSQLYGCSGTGWNLTRFDEQSNTFHCEFPDINIKFKDKVELIEKETSILKGTNIERTFFLFIFKSEDKKRIVCSITQDVYPVDQKGHLSSIDKLRVKLCQTKTTGNITEGAHIMGNTLIDALNKIYQSRDLPLITGSKSYGIAYNYYKFSRGASIAISCLNPDMISEEPFIDRAIATKQQLSGTADMDIKRAQEKAYAAMAVTE